MIPTSCVLANVVVQFDSIEMADRDNKGDLYEYMLGKIATAGQNGQFRTSRHIIKLMVDMTAPTPRGRAGQLRRRGTPMPVRSTFGCPTRPPPPTSP